MPKVLDVGGIRVTALSDGTIHLPPMYYPGVNFGAHPELLAEDLTYQIPAGCYLVQGDGITVLVDAGIGPSKIRFPDDVASAAGLTHPPEWIAEGGLLPDLLGELGVEPADIDTVFLTHMHPDHIGWVGPGGRPFFPNADIVCGAIDWIAEASDAIGEAERRAELAIANAAGRVHVSSAPVIKIAPGVVGIHAPGHTPGHYIVRVTSGDDEVWLLGDAVHHPLQLNDAGVSFLLECEPDAALRAREGLFNALEDRNISIGMPHFPGLEFQRIVMEGGVRRWVAI